MSSKGNRERQLTGKIVFMLGLALVLLAQVPFWILGKQAIIPYHDQLDGELLTYVLRARYLGSGMDTIPEFLNGAAVTSLVAPAPLAVLLFKFLPALGAYLVLQIIGQMVAYLGIFLLAKRMGCNEVVASFAALLYAFLPFLPMYGLAQYGMPLLLWYIWELYSGERRGVALLYTAVYGSLSSLVLCGFAWLICWFAGNLWLIVKGGRGGSLGKRFRATVWLWAGWATLLIVYVLENIRLLGQILGFGEGGSSHKIEYALQEESIGVSFINYFLYGGDHSEDYHIWILIPVALAWILWVCHRQKWGTEGRQTCKVLTACVGGIAVLCMAASLWGSSLGVQLRSQLGTLGAFQFTRILWLVPMLWYVALALSLSLLWESRGWFRYVGGGISLVACGMLAFFCLKGAMVKPNLQTLLIKEYDSISWSDYLALGVMDQVENYLREQTGQEPEEYRVASLGIDPSAALYHGFYCVDGYSNNYSLEYKHAFREVIGPELERNDWLKAYYDDWGNRCYLFSSEIPGYYNIQKKSFWYNDLQIDTKALKQLGCDYILSAAYVVNAEEKNLVLLREEPFETPDSYYNIYLYEIVLQD